MIDLEAQNKYEILCTIYLCHTFHHGIHEPWSNNATFTELIPIKELPDQVAVSYGYSDYVVFEYQDLYHHFNLAKILTHPITKESLSEYEIRKLLYLSGL